jgi:hypothetical protein
MMPYRLTLDDDLLRNSDYAILDLLDLTLRASIQALDHLHPELLDEPPRPVAAFSSTEDRFAHVTSSTADALLAAVRAYRAAIDETIDF